MREITVSLGDRSYPICIGKGLLDSTALYERMLDTRQVMIVTDTNVAGLYLNRIIAALDKFGPAVHILPPGEGEKNLANMNAIISDLLERRYSRTACLVALGGGVIGDLTGFAAACYQRGIRFLQIPTTLLAQVDSSVGGKTAVNHPLGKNMIGAFHQPCGVIADTGMLESLPIREYRAGVAEVIKYGLIRDPAFHDWLEQHIDALMAHDDEAMAYAVERSCRNKAEVVAVDETETGLRATLNLGHTFAHAVETGLAYRHWLHGEAVGLGMLMAADLSVREGLLAPAAQVRIQRLIERAGLPLNLPPQLADTDLRELMSVDKKASHGRLKLILLKGIGEAVITGEFSEANLSATLDAFRSGAAGA